MTDAKSEPVDTGSKQADAVARQADEDKAKQPEVPEGETADDGEEGAAPEEEEQEEAGEAPPDESEEESEEPPQERKPLPRGVQRKINKLTRRVGESSLRIQELEQELERARSGQVQQKPPEDVSAVATDDPEPQISDEGIDFDMATFTKAMIAWNARQTEAKARVAKAQETARERQAKFVEHEEAFANSVPDYYEVSKAPNVPITRTMADIMLESPETAPAVAYYLGKNIDEAAAIAQMSPAAAGRAIGRIEASIGTPAPSQAPSRPVVKTPAPVSTLKPSGAIRKNLEDMPMDQYAAERDRQLKAKGLR